MRITVEPGKATGTVSVPPSKSMAHRLLICAAMSAGESRIHGISQCDDVEATLDCLTALGIAIERMGDTAIVQGKEFASLSPTAPLCCRESGSTLRFLLPPVLLCGKNVMLRGNRYLMQRPMGVYETLCKEKGLTYLKDEESVVVKGPLTAGEYSVVGNISSQFISGLLFALPTVAGDSVIRITPPVESRSYINLTVDALREFGIEILWQNDHTLRIKGGQRYSAHETTVEGDYSNAAFLEALNLFGGSVLPQGLRSETLQGDRVYRRYFDMLCKGAPTIHIGDCPDLGPILFSVAAAKNGAVFNGTRRLRMKESDRAQAMARELRKFGTSVTVYEDTVVIYPAEFHAPQEVLYGHNDHRIVMSLAVLLTLTGGSLDGAEAVGKSYPEFFRVLRTLGISVSENDQGV